MIGLLCLVLLSPAVFSEDVDVRGELFNDMKTAFSECIDSRLLTEYSVLHPILRKLNESFVQCRREMGPGCMDCMESHCNANYRIDWNEWKQFGYDLFGSDLEELLTKIESGQPLPIVDKRLAVMGTIAAVSTAVRVGSAVANNWDTISSVASWFGRRRRSTYPSFLSSRRIYDMYDTDCYQQCPMCDFSFSDGCSKKIMTMARMMRRLIQLYAANHTPVSLLSKIEYEPTNYELSSSSFGDVYVTARTPSGMDRYLSKYRLRFDRPEVSALEMAEEFIARWKSH